jgi:hypothetical protein
MAIISVKNVNKQASVSFIRFKRVFNIALLPVVVTTIKGLWSGSDVSLNKVLLIITVTIPGLLEVIGMLTSNDTIQTDTKDITAIDNTPQTKP